MKLNHLHSARVAWKQADTEARAAEEELAAALDSFMNNSGAAPSPALVSEVVKRRATASDRLTLVLLLVGRVASPRPDSA